MKPQLLKFPISILAIILFCFISFSYGYTQSKTENSLHLSQGVIQRFHLKSAFVDERNVDVWVPEGYTSTKEYSVLYMHDGQMLFDKASSWNKKSWEIDSTMQQLIDTDRIEDVIVVGIWNNGNKRHSEYFPQKAFPYITESQTEKLLKYMPEGALADNYLKFIVEELKPFIDSTFPTKKERTHTFIAGASMGGLISLYALCEYPDVFGGAGCISSHWIGTLEKNREIPEALNTYILKTLPSPGKHKIYFDYGTVGLDANYPEFQQMVNLTLKQKNYDEHSTRSLEFTGDDHNEDFWARRFHHTALFLLGK